ncbi:MAG: hypothetical protein ACKOQ4_15850 [Mycobacterium sp.]
MATSRHRWLGAGTLLVGVGAALAGSGVAHADSAGGGVSRVESSDSRAAGSVRALPRVRTPVVSVPAAAKTARPGPARAAAAPRSGSAPRPASRAAAPVTTYRVANPIPSRRQWYTNSGYCGEMSFVSAGLNYGQYMSQYDARALASNNGRQNLRSSQLLLGVNDVAAAKAMHLRAVPFNTAKQTGTAQFLSWVKSNVTAGYPVVIGVYMNQRSFYGSANPNAGDAEYDHIVTVTGFSSTRPLTTPAAYYSDDVITFSDNGLWTGTPDGLPQYVFSYALGGFPATRRQANSAQAPVYSLSSGADYGIAITGVADLDRETVPVRLTTSVNGESPAIANGSNARPAAKPVTLTITVSGLTAGKTYNLYRYNTMAAVPDSRFNASAGKASQKWTIAATGPTYTLTQTVMSNEIAAYRAVPVTAR